MAKKNTKIKASNGIKLNVNAKKKNIDNEAKRAIKEIKENAKRGIETTELTFDSGIYSEVRDEINAYMKKNNVSYNWLTMSGPVGMQSSVSDGMGGRLMKFKLKS